MKGLVGEGDVVQGPWGDAPAARKPVAVDKSADIVTLKRKPSANVAKMASRFLTSKYAPAEDQLANMDEEELAEEALRFLLDTFRDITKDMSAQDIYTLAQRMAREAYIQLDLDESTIMKGIVDEAEHVTVLYIDGKPSMKFTNKNEAHEQLERIKKKFPNKKFELKAEMRETKQRLDPKCWKGHHKEGTKIKGGVRVNNCVPNESVEEASSPAQQAAIAINMKKHHKKPKNESAILKGILRESEKFSSFDPAMTDPDFNPEDPVVLIHGIGTLNLSTLKRKTLRECEELLNELKSEKYEAAAYHSDQFYRTVKSLGESLSELKKYDEAGKLTNDFFKLNEYGFHPDDTHFSTGDKINGIVRTISTLSLAPAFVLLMGTLAHPMRAIAALNQLYQILAHALQLHESNTYSETSIKNTILNAAEKTNFPNLIKRIVSTIYKYHMTLHDALEEIKTMISIYETIKDNDLSVKEIHAALEQAIQNKNAPAQNPVVNEMPDTSGPVGTQSGGWRTYRPKPAGQFNEDTAYAGGMGQGHGGESYRKFRPKMAGTFNESELDEAAPLVDWLPPDVLGAIDVIRTYANGIGLGAIITGILSTLVNALHGKYKK